MSDGTLDRTRAPAPSGIRPFEFPPVHRERLDGSDSPELLVTRRGELPLVTIELVVEAGASAETAERSGIARLTASALEAGTTGRDEEALAWELESLGVQLDTAAGWDAASVAMTVHRDRLEPALELLADIVRRPAFPPGAVDRMRDQQLAEILQRRKEPRALASDAAARFIFGADVPYGRSLGGTEETVGRLDPDALRAFHQQQYRGASAALILAGAIEPGPARELVGRHFADWRGTAPAGDAFTVTPRVDSTTLFIVHRPGSVQSEIRLGHVGVERAHPDYFPLTVMNTILGGAFTSRLNMSLRERHGFTYGARSGFAFRRRPGPFSIDVAVGSDVTARAIQEAFREIRGLRQDGPTGAELNSARDYLRGALPLRLETTSQLASRVAELVIYDLPATYFDDYRDRIAAVTAEDVRRVALEAVRPDAMAIVVVGDADQIRDDLEALDLGPIEVHETLP